MDKEHVVHDIVKRQIQKQKKRREKVNKIIEKYSKNNENWFDTIMRIVEEYNFNEKGDKYVR